MRRTSVVTAVYSCTGTGNGVDHLVSGDVCETRRRQGPVVLFKCTVVHLLYVHDHPSLSRLPPRERRSTHARDECARLLSAYSCRPISLLCVPCALSCPT